MAPLTLQALNRATLARQLLLQRSTLTPLRAIERLAGLQAQAPNPPYVALWTRLARFEPAMLTRLLERRGVVRAATMRSTLHLLAPADYRAWRAALAPMLERSLLSIHGKALAGAPLAEIVETGCRLLEDTPMTHGELGRALAQRWSGHGPTALGNTLRNLAPLIHRPPAGTWGSNAHAQLVHVDRWLPPNDAAATTDDASASAQAMLLRYLAAFGPASVADFAAWSGLTGARAVVDAARERLVVLHDDEGRELFDLPRAPRPVADTPAPPRLLGEWDALLLSHADRRRVISEAHRSRVFTNNGIVRGTVLLDGFVAGMWKLARVPAAATISVEAFSRWPAEQRNAVGEEAARLLRFAAPQQQHTVRFAKLGQA